MVHVFIYWDLAPILGMSFALLSIDMNLKFEKLTCFIVNCIGWLIMPTILVSYHTFLVIFKRLTVKQRIFFFVTLFAAYNSCFEYICFWADSFAEFLAEYRFTQMVTREWVTAIFTGAVIAKIYSTEDIPFISFGGAALISYYFCAPVFPLFLWFTTIVHRVDPKWLNFYLSMGVINLFIFFYTNFGTIVPAEQLFLPF